MKYISQSEDAFCKGLGTRLYSLSQVQSLDDVEYLQEPVDRKFEDITDNTLKDLQNLDIDDTKRLRSWKLKTTSPILIIIHEGG